MTITKHAFKRSKERCGLNASATKRMAQKAFDFGVSADDVEGAARLWLSTLYFYNKTGNNVRLYGEVVYVFCEDVLVTVFLLPNRFRVSSNFGGETAKKRCKIMKSMMLE